MMSSHPEDENGTSGDPIVDVEAYLRQLKEREGPRSQCPARNDDGVRCEKALQASGAAHEDRHVAWVDGTRVEWMDPTPAPPSQLYAVGSGYTGDSCEICGSLRIVKSGTCGTCQDCGSTTGCS